MNLAIDKLKLEYQPKISHHAEVLEEYKRTHQVLLERKSAVDDKLAQVDKKSGTYVAHQIDRCRNKLLEMTLTLETKKEYQKRLRAKLQAYKEIAFMVSQSGGSEQQIKAFLDK